MMTSMPSRSFPLTIDRLSYGAAGVGRVNGKVVFVPETAPGDEVEVSIDEEKKGYARGHVVAVTRPSLHRRVPPCPYVQHCGGCSWQHVAYNEQLRAKEELVREQLRRIGGMSDIPLLPILPSPQEWHYRHRVRLRVADNTRVGFSPSRSHALVEIDSCLIAWVDIGRHLHAVREWIASLRTPVTQVELAIVQPSVSEKESQVVCIGEAQGMFQQEDALTCQRVLAAHPDIAGVMLRGREWSRVWGNTTLALNTGEDTLVVRDGAFTQVNPAANQLLVESLTRLSGVRNTHRVIELYCGAGNFSLPLARRARELVGVEQNGHAVLAARANAERAGVVNARFRHATVQAGVRELLKRGVQGDLVVLDPPRTGAADVIDDLARFGAHTIAYVSCDPPTLARDLRRLHKHGYHLHVVQPLDMFPQTYHVETIAVSVLTC
jgi:23S rRNA (uracil1939-C5)-methyltransferase